jgi:VanZ family protein
MTDRGRTGLFAALALAWAALIFWASSRPNPFPFLPSGLLSEDKLLHAAAYAVLAALVLAALASRRRRALGAILLAAALATAYGASDEWHQSYVPSRQPDLNDLVADGAGALAGAAVAAVILRRRRARASIRA